MRILVVDNDATWVDLVALDLRLEGHDIVGTALDAAAALAALEATPGVDVVVTDYRMPPGPNGIEVCTQVRDRFPATRAVLFTNYLDATLADWAGALGAAFVAKPDLRALRRALLTPPGSGSAPASTPAGA